MTGTDTRAQVSGARPPDGGWAGAGLPLAAAVQLADEVDHRRAVPRRAVAPPRHPHGDGGAQRTGRKAIPGLGCWRAVASVVTPTACPAAMRVSHSSTPRTSRVAVGPLPGGHRSIVVVPVRVSMPMVRPARSCRVRLRRRPSGSSLATAAYRGSTPTRTLANRSAARGRRNAARSAVRSASPAEGLSDCTNRSSEPGWAAVHRCWARVVWGPRAAQAYPMRFSRRDRRRRGRWRPPPRAPVGRAR